MAIDRHDGRHSVGALVRELADESTALLRGEVRLARMEVTDAVAGIRDGTILVATAGVLALLGALSLIASFVLLVGDQWLPHNLYWLAALIVVVVASAIAAWLARRGMTLLSPTQLAPTETVTTLKEDTEWLKQRLTSGATSS